MTVRRAVYGDDGNRAFVPFNYTPRAVVAGAELEEDFAIYGELTERCLSLPPTSTMLLFGGELATTLFLRRAETSVSWKEFKTAFLLRYPSFEVRYNRISNALSELAVPYKNGRRPKPNFPLVVFGAALLATVPASVHLKIEAPLPNVADHSRCDVELTSDGPAILRSEIYGMVSRSHGALTEHGHQYLERQPRRLGRYSAAGLPPPFVVFADDLWDASRVKSLIREARERLGGCDFRGCS